MKNSYTRRDFLKISGATILSSVLPNCAHQKSVAVYDMPSFLPNPVIAQPNLGSIGLARVGIYKCNPNSKKWIDMEGTRTARIGNLDIFNYSVQSYNLLYFNEENCLIREKGGKVVTEFKPYYKEYIEHKYKSFKENIQSNELSLLNNNLKKVTLFDYNLDGKPEIIHIIDFKQQKKPVILEQNELLWYVYKNYDPSHVNSKRDIKEVRHIENGKFTDFTYKFPRPWVTRRDRPIIDIIEGIKTKPTGELAELPDIKGSKLNMLEVIEDKEFKEKSLKTKLEKYYVVLEGMKSRDGKNQIKGEKILYDPNTISIDDVLSHLNEITTSIKPSELDIEVREDGKQIASIIEPTNQEIIEDYSNIIKQIADKFGLTLYEEKE